MKRSSKILYVATSDIHIKTFHTPYLIWLKSKGHQVDIAAEKRANHNFIYISKYFNILFPRSIFKKEILNSYRKLKSILKDNCYDLIHCHTPIPSALIRLAARKYRKNGTKVIYTAHGFHFYKGAPVRYWIFYYTAEYLLSYLTDVIITINNEDFGYIKDKMMHKDSYLIKGIGVDSSKFKVPSEKEKEKIRSNLGYTIKNFILFYIAEFIYRKNHIFIIESACELKNKIPNLKILFAGTGPLLNQMKDISKKNHTDEIIDFLGFRDDVNNFAAIADVGISSSRHEGLGLGLAEMMLCSVPVVATVDKGHKELVENEVNGFLYPQDNKSVFINCILKLYRNPELRIAMGQKSYEKAQEFKIENSLKSMEEIYNRYLV